MFLGALGIAPALAVDFSITDLQGKGDANGIYTYETTGNLEVSQWDSGSLTPPMTELHLKTDGSIAIAENPNVWSGTLKFGAEDPSESYAFDITALNVSFQGAQSVTNFDPNVQFLIGKNSIVTGNLSLEKAGLVVQNGTFTIGNMSMTGAGHLQVNGNLNLSNSGVAVWNGGDISVSGTTNITNTTFRLLDMERDWSKIHLLDSQGAITFDSTSKVVGTSARLIEELVALPDTINCTEYNGGCDQGYSKNTDRSALVDYTLVKEGNSLYAVGSFTQSSKSQTIEQIKAAADLEILKDFKAYADEQVQYWETNDSWIPDTGAGDTRTKEQILAGYQELQKSLQDEITKREEELKTDSTTSPTTPAVANGATSAQSLQEQILDSLRNSSNQSSAINYLVDYAYGDGGKSLALVQEISQSAESSANLASYNGISQAINAVNDIAISQRLAKWGNPYRNYAFATTLKNAKLAANGDVISYFNRFNYTHNVWANVFGGMSMIGQNNGAIYGLSAGYDNKLGSNTLLGAYLTYAYAGLKDTALSQNTQNIQAGIYTRSYFGASELDISLRYQMGFVAQERVLRSQTNSADFTNQAIMASANYGYVFGSEGFFVKPLVGVNFYYFLTPAYSEKGNFAQSVSANNTMNVSLNIGADVRKYFENGSFIYILPKIEQYVFASDNTFTTAFVGSNTAINLQGTNALKTYAQVLIGGDLAFSENLALNIGVGVKQIVAGKVDSKNETYLNGSVGVKYRF